MTTSSNNDKKGGGRLASVERVLMAATMGALCVITMANVLVRYFTDMSFAFTEEISIALMVVMTLVGASRAFAAGHHLAIQYFAGRLPGVRRIAPRLAAGCSLLMFALLAIFGARMAWDDYDFEVTSPSLGVPQWWYSIWLPVLSVLIVARLIGLLRRGGR
ncbi:MAG: TRAP transporter small permease [Candidatus Accumulibacter sp.]|jgi:TRAP-type C4-dicarboxylate transport system permease small subunit|nr:TRAP transporter small permease [Accumulibacter sp.]